MNNNTRTQNSIRNVSYGLIITVLNTIVSFVTRTVLVKTLGAEILGLNGLFTEVIAMLSLVELGVGMAIIYSLYKPISENDQKKISQLMGLYRVAYNSIALITFVIGLAITPFIDKLITDVDYPLYYIRIIFILFVIKTASTYLFSYKTSLLNADQKQYIVSLVNAVVKMIMTVALVIELLLLKNYILYLVLLIIQSIATNIILSRYVDKKYPFIDYKDKLEKSERNEVLSNVKNIFVKRVSGVVTSSTDNILISKLVSTIQVGFYSNYVMIFSVVRTLTKQFTNSVAASIGNLSVTESPDRCIIVLKRLTYLYFVFGMIMASGLMGASKAFMTIWLGNAYVMPNIIVFVAIFNLFLEICCEPLWQFLEVSGLFKQDKYIGLIGSTINLIVSIMLGLRIGITGIFLGTVCTQVIQMILKTILIFKNNFKLSSKPFFVLWIKMILSYVALVLFQLVIDKYFIISNNWLEFFVKGTLSVTIAIIVSSLLFLKDDEVKYCLQMIGRVYRKVTGKG